MVQILSPLCGSAFTAFVPLSHSACLEKNMSYWLQRQSSTEVVALFHDAAQQKWAKVELQLNEGDPLLLAHAGVSVLPLICDSEHFSFCVFWTQTLKSLWPACCMSLQTIVKSTAAAACHAPTVTHTHMQLFLCLVRCSLRCKIMQCLTRIKKTTTINQTKERKKERRRGRIVAHLVYTVAAHVHIHKHTLWAKKKKKKGPSSTSWNSVTPLNIHGNQPSTHSICCPI